MPITRFSPSRNYLLIGCGGIVLAAVSVYFGTRWTPALVPAVLLLLSAISVLFLGLQPDVEIHEEYLRIGKRLIRWSEIRRLDRTSWFSPLMVYLTLAGDKRILLIYPGDFDAANGLLRHLRRYSREALIDGVPYRQFWGETLPSVTERRQLTSPKYQLLRPEDEAEVERMYQRLKTVGHLDPKQSDEK